jgi:M6 family metalloprotease-like protein
MFSRGEIMRKLILLIVALVPVILFAAYLENLPTQVTQPDGSILNLLASGDEFANRLHDANGFTIIQSKTDGFYYYAQKNGDELVPSVWRVGSTNPAGKSLVPNLNISEAAYKAKARFMSQHDNPNIRTPQTGTVNNICVLISFVDQTEFDTPRSAFDYKFNAQGDSVNSLRNYFSQTSYDQLDIITSIFPNSAPETNLSYVDSYPRSYYLPYNSFTNPNGYMDDDARAMREQTMLANAIAAIAPQVPSTLNIDADNDDYVDNVCFIIRGPHSAWADLLWAHRWGLYYQNAFINGKQVMDYTFQPENQNEVYILCHEMFHSVGSPDLYHYNFNGVSPVGCWDLMESGKGHMGAYMKKEYGGWLPSPTVISQTGDYVLNPLTSQTDNFYRINVAGHANEYFILEYRKKGSDFFEQNLPESGLLIYRINTGEQGNAQGPPDEVYLYRPDGTSAINGQITEAAFSQNSFRTEFNDFTNPNCAWTNGSLAHLNISNISYCGETISFHYANNTTNLPPQVTITSPADGVVLPLGNLNFNVTATAQNATITNVVFFLDENFVGEDSEAPYSITWSDSTGLPGYHELIATATASNGLFVSQHSRFRMIDPQQENWFTWATDTPDYDEYGRGAVPIQVAIDLDLGLDEYVVKGLAFYITDDTFGDPAVPGLVSAKINRFSNGIITTETLLDLGNYTVPMTGRFEMDIVNNTILNNEIAVILNLYEYQNIMFDRNGIAGHSWLTEPDRPWTDALGRGMLGAADIALKLQSPYVSNPDNGVPVAKTSLSNYPNPFNSGTTFSYSLTKDGNASLTIYNLKGQKVKTLLNGKQAKGNHELSWKGTDDNGKAVGSGIYLVKLIQNGKVAATKKIAMFK